MPAEPARTCIGCRARAPKRELVRIAAAPDGARVDPTGTAAGRGAYVHRDGGCLRAALRDGTLARALRTGLGQDELARLEGRIEEVVRRG
jgi:predicted RNA-binding protein YlxR (DUF448 family)